MANSKYKVIIEAFIDPAQVQSQLNKINLQKPVKVKANMELDQQSIDNQVQRWNNALAKMEARKPAVFKSEEVQKEVKLFNSMIKGFEDGVQPIGNVRTQLDNVNTAMTKVSAGMRNLAHDGLTVSQMISTAIKKVAIWAVGTAAIYGTLRKIREMVDNVKALNVSLVELQKVSTLAGASLRVFTLDAFRMAETVGKTGKEAIDAVTTFVRGGYAIAEALDLAKVALMMTNVAIGISDAEEAAGAMIAILRAYRLEAEDAVRVMDILNEVSNTQAVEFHNLTDGMRRTAGTLSQTGTSVEELTALLTGGYEVLRNMEMVSSGLIMISQRFAIYIVIIVSVCGDTYEKVGFYR